MLHINGKVVSLLYLGKKVVRLAYRNSALVWQTIRSCFGAGYWQNDSPWDNTDGYKN